MATSPLSVARHCYRAYVDKDREAIEALIAKDYHFTSPIDNALDRDSYFTNCWPNSAMITGFDPIYEVEDGNRVFVVYEGHAKDGKTFRNCEVHTVRDGMLVETEVYFGWNLPHKVPWGRHIENEGEGHA